MGILELWKAKFWRQWSLLQDIAWPGWQTLNFFWVNAHWKAMGFRRVRHGTESFEDTDHFLLYSSRPTFPKNNGQSLSWNSGRHVTLEFSDVDDNHSIQEPLLPKAKNKEIMVNWVTKMCFAVLFPVVCFHGEIPGSFRPKPFMDRDWFLLD